MQRFELLGRNGSGANSTVYKCRDTASSTMVAVKKLEGAGVSQILQEAAIMRICAHKHCVELLEAYQSSNAGVVYLVMENVEHALSRELLLNPRGLPLPKAKLIAFQLAQALELIHSKQVSHGDMKPANILLTSQYSVKLCDFGSATTPVLNGCGATGGASTVLATPAASPFGTPQPPPPAVPYSTAAASRWYCAPESLLGLEGSTPASDVWALGCILAELVTGKPLMPGSEEDLHQLCCVLSMIGHLSERQERVLELLPWEQRAKVEQARARGPLLDRVPKIAACKELLSTVRACLHPDPTQRPTAQQLQGLAFFADIRQALQTSAAAAAGSAAAVGDDKTSLGAPKTASPVLVRRSSSGDMDVAPAAIAAGGASSPDSAAPCPAAMPAAPASGAAPAGPAAPGVTASASPPRRVSGVQAASPLRPVTRTRVSALTATIRGNPFDGDGGYTDLMPQVLRLVARWQEQMEQAEDKALGPIALAARRASSVATGTALPSAAELSGELHSHAAGPGVWTFRSNSFSSVGAAAAAAVAPVTAACTTPIAAAAGGCGAVRLPSSTSSPPAAAAAAGPSPMDCSLAGPLVGATMAVAPPAAGPVFTAGELTADACSNKPSISLSASVGAVPYMSVARHGMPTSASVAAGAAAAAAKVSSPPQLRSRAIINRARRHTSSREPRSGSVPLSFLTGSPSSCPRSGGVGGSGLGSSATLLQREIAAAAAPAAGPSGVGGGAGVQEGACNRPLTSCGLAPRAPCHAARRSFADLSDLASVAEYAPLACGTTPEGKRRRGLFYGIGMTHGSVSQASASAYSLASLQTELSLGSLPECEPTLFTCSGVGGTTATAAVPHGGRRMHRSSSGGSGIFATGSPVRPSAWPQQHQHWAPAAAAVAACGAARAVNIPVPQPASGRGRAAGRPGRGLAGSVSSDVVEI